MKPSAVLLSAFLLGFATARCVAAPGDVDLAFDPGSGVDNTVFAIAAQPDGKLLIGGEFSTVRGLVRKSIARLNGDGSGDSSFVPALISGASVRPAVRAIALQPDGKVVLAGDFTLVGGAARPALARLNADGSLDTTFDPGTGPTGSANTILALAVQSDGKMVIGGGFTTFNGLKRARVARLNSDGSVDASFDPALGPNVDVAAVALQPDGKVLIGGSFTLVNGTPRNRIARLNADGTLDTAFDAGAGPNFGLKRILVQLDGKVLIGGTFSSVNSVNRSGIARLNADGSVDSTFNLGGVASIDAITLQSDGKIVVGGGAVNAGTTLFRGVARLNPDGKADATFDPGTGAGGFNNYQVHAVALQLDGRIVVGGRFWQFNGVSRDWLARLDPNGALDTTFIPGNGITGGDFPALNSIAIQEDDKAIIGGMFLYDHLTGRTNIARLNADGTLDATFAAAVSGPSSFVPALALQANGQVLAGGNFNAANGVTRRGLARLNANGTLDSAYEPRLENTGRALTIAVQADGKAVIGGSYSMLNTVSRAGIGRLNPDSSIDLTFNPGSGVAGSVSVVAIQSDGKVLIGGDFTTVNGVNRRNIARLNNDGSVDSGFNPPTFDNALTALAVQADGKVVVGGRFLLVGGMLRNGIARLNPDGMLDATFDPAGLVPTVYALATQADGKILVGGSMLMFLLDPEVYGVVRLNTDGKRDTSFQAAVIAPNTSVNALSLQKDGGILMGGNFTFVNNLPRWRIARLLGDAVTVAPLRLAPPAISGKSIILRWNAASGASYLLQFTEDIQSGAWQALGPAITATASEASLVTAFENAPRFYRVAILP